VEGRDALFVLPNYELAVTLPIDTRVLAIHLDWETEPDIKRFRFSGRVPGHILVLLPNTIVDDAFWRNKHEQGPCAALRIYRICSG
jgi:hypothetical protein